MRKEGLGVGFLFFFSASHSSKHREKKQHAGEFQEKPMYGVLRIFHFEELEKNTIKWVSYHNQQNSHRESTKGTLK